MSDVRRLLRTLALAGALLSAALPAAVRAQAPAGASLCPPPPRALTFAISATSATRKKPAARKPAAHPRSVHAVAVKRRVPVVAVRTAAASAPAVKRPRTRPARPKSVVPTPRPAGPAKVAKATQVCEPWKHELAPPLVGMVASAETPTRLIPLVAGTPSPFTPQEPVVEDDSSSVAPFWWMLPAGGIAIVGAAGHGSEGGAIGGVGEGRGASGTPVIPGDTRPPVAETPVGEPGAPSGTPGEESPPTAPDGGTPETPGTEFVPLPPPPPVGSTTPPGGGGDFPPPPGTPPEYPTAVPPTDPPGTPPGTPPGGPPGNPPGGPNTPPIDEPPPTISTAVVPEPAPLGLVLMGGGVLSLVAWGVSRR